MGILESVLVVATFLCALVTGLLFAFSIVVMPGFKNLGDGEFIRAFQVIDRVIQDNQPIFIIAWAGSAVTLVVACGLGIGELDGSSLGLLVAAAVCYLFFVQLPTFVVNIPLNNKLQAMVVDELDKDSLRAARVEFETRWNRWNQIRTCFACFTTLLLLVLLLWL